MVMLAKADGVTENAMKRGLWRLTGLRHIDATALDSHQEYFYQFVGAWFPV